ncbi:MULTISPECIES: protein-disulfide reductase DsbD [unclassified Chromobacterium]|uniref:protein-disulfide reductase DsbD n=1 Tax=unclassified Chromobacterium TaxID=2641838 RepID=UPI001F2C926D|nr:MULTISPECIES: protein-disulfide reductase DsbD [unclassified Chromobacterium]MCP1292548.1 protein-disulfide reductase DsbD [Chromobacterium sp. S0633]UJB32660.1 protein-disulfide reductase DsbD [Chromobacterium sp. Beijing]
MPLIFRSLLLLLFLWMPTVQAQTGFLPPEQAFRLSVSELGDGQVRLRWDIRDGYYLYRKNIKIAAEPAGSVPPPAMPAGKTIHDEFFGESEVYYQRLELLVRAGQARRLALSWQGCAEAGLCYPPQHRVVELSGGGQAVKTATAGLAGTAPAAPALGEDQALAARLAQSGVGWVLLAFFGLGLLMTFTPCVLPMVPILSSLIVGSGATPRRGLVLALAFVLPMALTYAALGALAASMGANLQAALQTPWALGLFAALFILLALAMFGVYELQLPAVLRDRLAMASQRQRGGTLGGAAAMGVLSALLVGPCMTAPLAGALLYISDSGDVLKGGLALLAMGLGMGVPLLLVGALGAKLLPRPGLWMNRVKAVFGFLLLGMAIWFLDRVLPPAASLALWGAWLFAVAVGLLTLSRPWRASPGQWTLRGAAALLGLWAAAMLIGAAAGQSDPLRPLAFVSSAAAPATDMEQLGFVTVRDVRALQQGLDEAARQGRWALVDYYADWCVACKEIEHKVFGDPLVRQALAGMTLLRPDVTESGPDSAALLASRQVIGPPTLLLIGPDGQERRAQRIVGALGPDAFLERLSQARRAR